jgi:uncharacterized surface protein with fasciclin (FAS1) repeats
MRNRFLMSSVAVVLGFSLVAAACADDDSDDTTTTTEATTTTAADDMTDDMDGTDEASGETIVDIAAGNEDFSTLVTAVTEAGLVETLSGEGPFTVFAPTNEAFDALPEGTLETLLEDPEGDLTAILQLHVISGEVMAADAAELVGECVETLGGQVRITEEGGELSIGGAPIVDTDIEASNGVIHVLGGVITEPSADC